MSFRVPAIHAASLFCLVFVAADPFPIFWMGCFQDQLFLVQRKRQTGTDRSKNTFFQPLELQAWLCVVLVFLFLYGVIAAVSYGYPHARNDPVAGWGNSQLWLFNLYVWRACPLLKPIFPSRVQVTHLVGRPSHEPLLTLEPSFHLRAPSLSCLARDDPPRPPFPPLQPAQHRGWGAQSC